MARKQTEFTVEAWDNAAKALEGLEPKAPKERKVNAKDGLLKIKESIIKARENGYTYDEIVKLLKDNKIAISMSTFKEYWSSEVEKSKGKKTIRKPGAKRVSQPAKSE